MAPKSTRVIFTRAFRPKQSNADLNTAAKKGGLLPSFAHGMTLELGVKGAIQDVVTEHFNSNMSSQDAVKKIAAAVKAAS